MYLFAICGVPRIMRSYGNEAAIAVTIAVVAPTSKMVDSGMSISFSWAYRLASAMALPEADMVIAASPTLPMGCASVRVAGCADAATAKAVGTITGAMPPTHAAKPSDSLLVAKTLNASASTLSPHVAIPAFCSRNARGSSVSAACDSKSNGALSLFPNSILANERL